MAEKITVQVDFDQDVGAIDFTKLTKNNDADDDDVKDNWDDDSEDEVVPAVVAASEPAADTKPKKKSAKQIAAEKEEAKLREKDLIRQQLLENSKPKTADEIAEEKRRIRQAQEDSDFAMGADTFLEPAESITNGTGALDSFEPNSVEKFDEFRRMLTEKIMKYEKSEYYPGFLNSLFQDLALHLPSEEVRKFGATLTTLAGEKAKHEKEKTKGKGKVGLKKKAGIAGAGKKDDTMATYDDYDHDPVDDFF